VGRHVQTRGLLSASNLLELIAARAAETPHRDAVIGVDRRVSYGELIGLGLSYGRRLKDAGIEAGDRVAIVAENSPDYLIALLGIWDAGGIAATVYPSSSATELCYVLQNATPRLVLVDADRRDVVTGAIRSSEVDVDTAELDLNGLTSDLCDGVLGTNIDSEAPAVICYTSGTSSRPKPVVHSHSALARQSRLYASVWHISQGERTLVAVPLAWMYGLVTGTTSTLVSGGTVVVLPRFHPANVVEIIESEQITFFPVVTTMVVKLVAYVREFPHAPRLSSLRFCVSGGEPRNEPVFDAWKDLTGCPVHDVYAASECFPLVTYDPHRDPEPQRGSAGRVVPGAELRLVDAQGLEVSAGDVGEALARSPGLMVGYWNEPELTESAMTQDGWYRTHDYARMDTRGYVFITGRQSDMIIRGGSNVSPAEVEAVLIEHPDVAQAAVVGIPDLEYGEQVAAAVVLVPGAHLDVDELRAFCSSQIAHYKIPTVFQLCDDLPRNESGKVLRRELRAFFAAGRAPRWSAGKL